MVYFRVCILISVYTYMFYAKKIDVYFVELTIFHLQTMSKGDGVVDDIEIPKNILFSWVQLIVKTIHFNSHFTSDRQAAFDFFIKITSITMRVHVRDISTYQVLTFFNLRAHHQNVSQIKSNFVVMNNKFTIWSQKCIWSGTRRQFIKTVQSS